jgi:transcriptional regulator of arginine metabolism
MSRVMNRLKRQTMIKRLVTENEIHTQSELLALLEKENIHTTQATISRDIRELNLNKIGFSLTIVYFV